MVSLSLSLGDRNAEWNVWPPRLLLTPFVLAWEAPHQGRFFPVNSSPPRVLGRVPSFQREEGEGDCDIWTHRCWEEPACIGTRQAAQWRNYQRRLCPGLKKRKETFLLLFIIKKKKTNSSILCFSEKLEARKK